MNGFLKSPQCRHVQGTEALHLPELSVFPLHKTFRQPLSNTTFYSNTGDEQGFNRPEQT